MTNTCRKGGRESTITPRRGHWTRRIPMLLAAVSLSVVTSCAAFSDTPTPLPTPAPSAPPSTSAPNTAPPAQCTDALQSYEPTGGLPKPDALPSSSRMEKIHKRGRLIAGVSADTYKLASRNPQNGQIEGFDIDMVKAVARAIFGDENKYQLKVITAAERIPVLQDREVDLVARNMTITCDRWTQVAFSTEYYRSGQKILVRKGSKATSLAELAGKRVCAPNGTSSIKNLIALAPKAIAVGSDSHTGCLVLFQQGKVDAITGDDTVLAGLAAQDPYALVPKQKTFTEEPYGLAFNSADVDLVRFVNARLEQLRTDGEWKDIYNRWLAESLGPAPEPPKAVYGRTR